jgi:hypothetical protein
MTLSRRYILCLAQSGTEHHDHFCESSGIKLSFSPAVVPPLASSSVCMVIVNTAGTQDEGMGPMKSPTLTYG